MRIRLSRMHLAIVPLALMLFLAACNGDGEGAPANGDIGTEETLPGMDDTNGDDAANGEQVELEIGAEQNRFDRDTLTAPAGAQVRLTLDNREAVPHNVAIYGSDDLQQEIFVGETFSGPDTMTYEFQAPDEPGEYFFLCDVHPTTMTGDFIVE
jgi:plastocyanin